jgi:hypothetical protein
MFVPEVVVIEDQPMAVIAAQKWEGLSAEARCLIGTAFDLFIAHPSRAVVYRSYMLDEDSVLWFVYIQQVEFCFVEPSASRAFIFDFNILSRLPEEHPIALADREDF